MFGVFAVGFGLGCFGTWEAYRTEGAHFLLIQSGRQGFTTFDHMIGLGAVTVLCGIAFAFSLVSLFSPKVGEPIESQPPKDAADSNAGPAWTCPGCGEENPGNFEECWKCQRNRPLDN
jgi:hypothetical protein